MHYFAVVSSTAYILVWALLLLACQLPLQCNCALAAPRSEAAAVTAKLSSGCAISSALPENTLLRHWRSCSKPIPESQFSYSVQSAWGPGASSDSLHNTVFTYADNGNPTGSFELSHSLRPSDALLILLTGKDETGYGQPTCQRLVLCNLSVDGPGQRLRLNVSLRVDHSYTMKTVKLADASVMCDEPQLRFFYASAKTSTDPLIQLAVKRCQNCAAAAANPYLTCQADIYLRAHDMGRAWNQVRLESRGSDMIDFSDTNAHSRNGWVKRQVPELRISTDFLVFRFFRSSEILYTPRFTFFKMTQSGGSLRDQICHTGQIVSPCPSAQLPPHRGGPPLWNAQMPPVHVALLLGFSLAAVTIMAAATLVWSCYHRRPGRHILLVYPEAATTAADRLRRCVGVARFRRELLATDTVKRGRLSVREVAGLRRLTPALARDSCLIIFLSDDPAFSCFSLDGLSGDVSLALKTVITEKSRTRGLFVTSGPPPPAASDWALLVAQRLGEDGVDHGLRALDRIENV